MVIITKKCSMCPETIRANGSLNFGDKVSLHIANKHPEWFNMLREMKKSANLELDLLKKKYPRLRLTYGFFSVDDDKALEG